MTKPQDRVLRFARKGLLDGLLHGLDGEEMMEYNFEIFVSYRRKGNIPYWVQSVLVPEVKSHLEEYLVGDVRIAVDVDLIEAGDAWPSRLSQAHAKSKIFLVVLSATYFRSGWCMSEWRNAVDRQKHLKAHAIEHPPLIIPVRYNDFEDQDIDALPPQLADEVREIQREDFGEFTQLVNGRGDNDRALRFRDAVELLCEGRLRHSIVQAPTCRDDWPQLPVQPYTSDDPRWKSSL